MRTVPLLFFFSVIFLFSSCGIEKGLYNPDLYAHPGSAPLGDVRDLATVSINSGDQVPETRMDSSHSEILLVTILKHHLPVAQKASAPFSLRIDPKKIVYKIRRSIPAVQRKNGDGETMSDILLVLVILFEFALVGLIAWCATLIFPGIPIWLAILIGLLVLLLLSFLIVLIANMGAHPKIYQ